MAGTSLTPGARIGFIGLGNMGLPMARRLAEGGYAVQGYDVSARARDAMAQLGVVADSPADAARGAAAVVLMLPSSVVVDHVVREERLLDAAGLLIDMGSSDPLCTRALASEAAARGAVLVDAPVSGGVAGARAGTLTIMFGGDAATADACRPLLGRLGEPIVHVGPVGAGHAVKALNNLLSATSLLATSEAVAIGRRFGLDPGVMIDAINASSGRSGSSEQKFPRFVLPGNYASGFALRLMAKDASIALSLGRSLGVAASVSDVAARLWAEASAALPPDADHTEIARWVLEGNDGQVDA